MENHSRTKRPQGAPFHPSNLRQPPSGYPWSALSETQFSRCSKNPCRNSCPPGAMISDAVHSASDVFSSIIVIIGVKISAKDSDRDHPYGHERFECVAAIVLAVTLIITGLFIGHTALEQITAGSSQQLTVPGLLAMLAAVVSIIAKEAMYWYTRFYAKRLDSGALMADAWHHRSDALSSVGALIGIAGARMGSPLFWIPLPVWLSACLFSRPPLIFSRMPWTKWSTTPVMKRWRKLCGNALRHSPVCWASTCFRPVSSAPSS